MKELLHRKILPPTRVKSADSSRRNEVLLRLFLFFTMSSIVLITKENTLLVSSSSESPKFFWFSEELTRTCLTWCVFFFVASQNFGRWPCFTTHYQLFLFPPFPKWRARKMNYVGILMISLRRTCQNKSSRQKLKKKKSTFELLAFFKPRVQFVTRGINGERTINVREITWRHRRRKLGNGMGFKNVTASIYEKHSEVVSFFSESDCLDC